MLLAALAPPGCRRPPPRGVVLIVVDTLRADHLGAYGYGRPTSPHLDRRARGGVVFEQALASSPWTLPSIASILTGRWPSHHGAGSRLRESGWKQVRRLDEAVPALAELLRGAGYATAAVVNNGFLAPGLGLGRGFETYDHRFASNWKSRRADATLEAALAWLDTHGRGRFFLFVHLFDPHLAYDAPAPVRGRFTGAYPEFSTRPGRPQEVRARLDSLTAREKGFIAAAYDEEIAFVDLQLGRFFDALDHRGLWERALVVLTADHGEELFDHGGFEHGHSVYQEVLRVPLIVWGPGLRPRREPAPASIVDVMPTVLEALREPAPAGLDGVSLWPAATRGRPPAPRALLAEGTLHLPERRAIVRWPYKLSEEPGSGRRRLFDLAADPRERLDLAPLRPRVAQRLGLELERALRAPGLGGRSVPLDDALIEDLRSLGYVE